MKSQYPYHNKASSVDRPLFPGEESRRYFTSYFVREGEESIVFCRKKAYARSSLEAKSLIAKKREERF